MGIGIATALACMVAISQGQTLSPEIAAKVQVKSKEIEAWGKDPVFVAAVRAHNTQPTTEVKAMTNEKWKSLSLLDPFARSFTKNPLALELRLRRGNVITECFVSGADGTKVAFLSKPTSWSHTGKEKHTVPMSGRVWYGPVEIDASSGAEQVQVAVPVIDGGKSIGSIVVGLSVAKMKTGIVR